MKVLLRRNVGKLGQIGDLVEVRPGYARNYLIPQGLAMAPSEANLRAIEQEKQAYLAELAQRRAELETQAKLLDGKEFNITARANEEGHLYGSVGPAQIAAVIARDGPIIDAEDIVLDEPLRKLDKYDVDVRFGDEAKATVAIWIVPPRDEGSEEAAGEADPPLGAESGEEA